MSRERSAMIRAVKYMHYFVRQPLLASTVLMLTASLWNYGPFFNTKRNQIT